MKEKKSFLVYFDWAEPFSSIDDRQLGELFRGMIRYAKDQTPPNFNDPVLGIIFAFIKSALDRDRKEYEKKCKINAENAKKGVAKRNGTTEVNLPPHDFSELLKTVK
ncbi:MAG: hypothetical protein IKT55_00610 [Clostridia bacterium]|nr:hypothetical protein [Clostridia bacterium]